jgi:hypothetical protein
VGAACRESVYLLWFPLRPPPILTQGVPFLSTNTDDDNTSAFVRDIDSKRRLNGHDWPCEHAPLSVYERAVTAADVDLRPDGTGSGNGGTGVGRGEGEGRPGMGRGTGDVAMPTGESAYKHLRQINAIFLAVPDHCRSTVAWYVLAFL